ncbi:hypothetical protein BJ878DRAFT_523715 [Calycina marina]|uniref:Uncharacterized protein n=1 Tax=Calycina marina TaxID=1763456 RepID=A0A9P7YWB3_9HELO|nr:hypothetical protein BJ878DRAFT_523715 [Calycina marina]
MAHRKMPCLCVSLSHQMPLYSYCALVVLKLLPPRFVHASLPRFHEPTILVIVSTHLDPIQLLYIVQLRQIRARIPGPIPHLNMQDPDRTLCSFRSVRNLLDIIFRRSIADWLRTMNGERSSG